MDLPKLFKKAQTSAFFRWILNNMLDRMIPFNRPHNFQITEVGESHLKVLLPFKKRNLNHIRGIHACALATVSEFTSGLLLISKLDASKYRLIMKRLEMDYHYQGKMNVVASFSVTEEWLVEKVFNPLTEIESVILPCEVKIHDIQGNLISVGKVFWQIKDWRKVKTKVDI
jgi:acyl-coenzyme A thioesterase PaaI-like protein